MIGLQESRRLVRGLLYLGQCTLGRRPLLVYNLTARTRDRALQLLELPLLLARVDVGSCRGQDGQVHLDLDGQDAVHALGVGSEHLEGARAGHETSYGRAFPEDAQLSRGQTRDRGTVVVRVEGRAARTLRLFGLVALWLRQLGLEKKIFYS